MTKTTDKTKISEDPLPNAQMAELTNKIAELQKKITGIEERQALFEEKFSMFLDDGQENNKII